MLSRKLYGLLLPLVTAIMIGPVSPVEAARTIYNCSPVITKIISSSRDDIITSQTTFIPVPEMVAQFTQGGTAASCIIAEIQAAASVADSGNFMVIDARLDNNDANNYLGMPEPPLVVKDQFGKVHAYKFIWPSVPPGPHTVKLYFRSDVDAQNVYILNPVMIIYSTK